MPEQDVQADLQQLKQQVQDAIDCYEQGNLREMTWREREDRDALFGKDAIVLRNFVIKKRD